MSPTITQRTATQRTYTPQMVERLLRNMLDIKYTLEARGQQLPDTYSVGPLHREQENTRHARPPLDGKAKARFLEELHVSILDIEEALPKMTDDDRFLLITYHILQTHTLDELTKERNVSSRGSMQRRIYRSVQRLTKIMDNNE